MGEVAVDLDRLGQTGTMRWSEEVEEGKDRKEKMEKVEEVEDRKRKQYGRRGEGAKTETWRIKR